MATGLVLTTLIEYATPAVATNLYLTGVAVTCLKGLYKYCTEPAAPAVVTPASTTLSNTIAKPTLTSGEDSHKVLTAQSPIRRQLTLSDLTENNLQEVGIKKPTNNPYEQLSEKEVLKTHQQILSDLNKAFKTLEKTEAELGKLQESLAKAHQELRLATNNPQSNKTETTCIQTQITTLNNQISNLQAQLQVAEPSEIDVLVGDGLLISYLFEKKQVTYDSPHITHIKQLVSKLHSLHERVIALKAQHPQKNLKKPTHSALFQLKSPIEALEKLVPKQTLSQDLADRVKSCSTKNLPF